VKEGLYGAVFAAAAAFVLYLLQQRLERRRQVEAAAMLLDFLADALLRNVGRDPAEFGYLSLDIMKDDMRFLSTSIVLREQLFVIQDRLWAWKAGQVQHLADVEKARNDLREARRAIHGFLAPRTWSRPWRRAPLTSEPHF
jgi:hypothetical protein